MPLRHRKDLSRLIGRTRIQGRRSRRHYLLAYLWEDRQAMLAVVGTDGKGLDIRAMHCPNVTVMQVGKKNEPTVYKSPPLLGEVHFVANDWNEEIVAHELVHAVLHRLEALGQGDLTALEIEDEEPICLEFGQWFDQVWSWLWKINPHGKHAGGVKS